MGQKWSPAQPPTPLPEMLLKISCSTALVQFLLVCRADESHPMSEPGCFHFFIIIIITTIIIIIDSSLWFHNINDFIFPTDCFIKSFCTLVTQKTSSSTEQKL